MKTYNKLVRDNIPEIIKSTGKIPITHKLSNIEYKTELEKKLKEEYNEVLKAKTRQERLEELADVYEVVKALATYENSSIDEIIKIADEKTSKRGAFNKQILLEKVIEKNE